MQLNINCIRDILLTTEDICDYDTRWIYDKNQPLPHRLNGYTHKEIIYHISQANKSNLLDNVLIYEGGDSFYVGDLSPSGHQFIANIRNDTFFNKVKSIGKEIGTNSLQDLTQIAMSCATMIIKAPFNLP